MFSGAFENYYFNGNYGLLSVQYKLSSITNICIKMLITTKNYLHFSQLKMSQRWGSEALTMEVNMHANIILVWNKFTNFTTLKSFMTLISSINESHSLVHASSGFFFSFFFLLLMRDELKLFLCSSTLCQKWCRMTLQQSSCSFSEITFQDFSGTFRISLRQK